LFSKSRRRSWRTDGDLHQDRRLALRSAARATLFTCVAVVIFAPGIGANAAVFGLVTSVLLNTLPCGDADRLVRVVLNQHNEGYVQCMSTD